MTGFGMGEAALGNGRVVLELRSLNHRFLEIRVRAPSEIVGQSFYLEQLARERLSRGRFDLGVRLEGAALPSPHLSRERARAVFESLKEMRDLLAPGTELSLSAITALPELILESAALDVDALQKSLSAALGQALARLDEMRAHEGAALGKELRGRIDTARSLVQNIAQGAEGLAEAHRDRLQARVQRLLTDTGVRLDPGRLELEVALLADRSDVAEEIARLGTHFDHFEHALSQDGPQGRRLDFLLQEMAREANTIGSKAQDASLVHQVVALRTEIERIREQVQNVE